MTDCAIRMENLTRDFDTVRAVGRLALEVPKGMIFGFLEPNGTGKTTTIRLLLGLLEPSQETTIPRFLVVSRTGIIFRQKISH